MATDKSEPRIGIIVQVAVIAIGTLIAVRGVLGAYFDHVAHAEELRKVGAPEALHSVRADEKQRLQSGPMPIEQAMQALAAKGRTGASPAIMPSASKDVAPLQGWSKLPGEVPGAMTAAPPPEVAPAAPATSSSAAPAGSAPAPAGSQKPKKP
jgi:hypothetical protein